MINEYIKKSNSKNHYANFTDKVIDVDWGSINYNRISFINKAVSLFDNCKYLEIGCESNICFNSIVCSDKTGVDPERGGTIKETSDDFFFFINRYFDVIFVDGLHTYDQTRKDVINSIKFLNLGGYIFIHDLVPRSWLEENVPRLQTMWTGDTWKVSHELNKTKGIKFNVIFADHGIGVIKKIDNNVKYFDDYKNLIDLRFTDFLKKINELNFVNYKDAFKIIKNEIL